MTACMRPLHVVGQQRMLSQMDSWLAGIQNPSGELSGSDYLQDVPAAQALASSFVWMDVTVTTTLGQNIHMIFQGIP